MRKIIVYNVISLDGYHTGLNNDVTVMFPMMGGVFDTYNAELLRRADVHLVGRVSFELFQSSGPRSPSILTLRSGRPNRRSSHRRAGLSAPSSSQIGFQETGPMSASSGVQTLTSRLLNSNTRQGKIF
jgi:hypothetical protein